MIPKSNFPSPSSTDSSRLWLFASLSSLVIHGLLFWVISWSLSEHQATGNTEKTWIPIEIIALTDEASPTPSPSVSEPSPKPAVSPSPASQPPLVEPSPQTTQPNVSTPFRSPTPFVTPSPREALPSPATPSQPSPSPSPRKVLSPPATPSQPSLSPTPKEVLPSPVTPLQPSPSPTPKEVLPSPVTPSQPSPSTNPSSSQQAKGLIAIVGKPRLVDPSRDIPDRLAQPRESSKQFSAVDYLTPLDINLSQDLVLEVVVTIDPSGKAELVSGSTQVQQGSLSTDIAEELASQILIQWVFDPTYMGGQPVMQVYFLPLTLRPLNQ